jgi:four helix bundle protein
MSGKRFEEMEVWVEAQELAVNVYSDFKEVRDYSFCDQIKRAAVSISNNISEGSERQTPADFARFLDISKGSAGEVRSMYHLAVKLGFVTLDKAKSRCDQCESISKQLAGFAKYLRRSRD